MLAALIRTCRQRPASGRKIARVIIDACGADTAAGLASAYRGGGLSDWYLPAGDELAEQSNVRTTVNVFLSVQWSSSQGDGYRGHTWPQVIDDDCQLVVNKA